MKKPPCMDCPDSGCGRHSSCEKYLAFWKERKADNQRSLTEKEASLFLTEQKLKTMRRNGKK